MDYFEEIPDLVDEGIIAIDSKGYVKVYNNMAKCIFGINVDKGPGHLEGRIEDGDIVIIADNMLGADDGGMTPTDLKLIGIDPQGVKQGMPIVAVGKKGEKEGTGVLRFRPQGQDENILLQTMVDDIPIEVSINFINKRLNIVIRNTSYKYDYLWALGHMVVLDGRSKNVKFYQAKGYTARKEDIKFILNGNPYKGKGMHGIVLDPIDKYIMELHPNSDVIRRLIDVAHGINSNIKGMESFINGIPVRCSIKAINKKSLRIGALLEVMDITELRSAQAEREKALITLKKMQDKTASERIQEQAFQNIISISSKMKDIIHTAKRAAETNATVLLLGESGTGKNLFAEAIHKASSRRTGPFVYINCASIPENLLESELFGHEKGAFTGAISEKQGKFELANGGTIFLDEINELPVTLQAKLLHVLQSRVFTKVGGLKAINVDIRIITASNKDLERLVMDGLFRSDLFYRINVVSITIPPLREHKEDLYLLIDYFMERLSKKIGCTKKEISPEAYKILFNYSWHGNIRELENVLERAMIMSDDVILPENLPHYISEETNRCVQGETLVDLKDIGPLKVIVEEAEKKAIYRALEISNGSRKKAMEMLGMGKTNFYEKLNKFGIWNE